MPSSPAQHADEARSAPTNFLPDGAQRGRRVVEAELHQCNRPRIQRQVQAEFADNVHGAGILRRLWLTFLMHREVRRRSANEISRRFPPDALYVAMTS